jgi:biopolymer transport protein ExbD
MPSVKMPKKSTDTDMTPFVDVAFLILSFFMLATKFKPPEPVEVTMPSSVSADKLKESDGIWMTIDKDSRVFFSVTTQKDKEVFNRLATAINDERKLGLSPTETASLARTFKEGFPIGVPFASLKQILKYEPKEQVKIPQPGVPVLDSATNELVWWVSAAKNAMAGKRGVLFLIKGDNISKFPTFDGVIDALKRNNELKYRLITSPEGVPSGSALEVARAEEASNQ